MNWLAKIFFGDARNVVHIALNEAGPGRLAIKHLDVVEVHAEGTIAVIEMRRIELAFHDAATNKVIKRALLEGHGRPKSHHLIPCDIISKTLYRKMPRTGIDIVETKARRRVDPLLQQVQGDGVGRREKPLVELKQSHHVGPGECAASQHDRPEFWRETIDPRGLLMWGSFLFSVLKGLVY